MRRAPLPPFASGHAAGLAGFDHSRGVDLDTTNDLLNWRDGWRKGRAERDAGIVAGSIQPRDGNTRDLCALLAVPRKGPGRETQSAEMESGAAYA